MNMHVLLSLNNPQEAKNSQMSCFYFQEPIGSDIYKEDEYEVKDLPSQ